ncbi:uncharacterized protein JCM6883_004574 [Sporobolomyces salmoneus]|uniref:uncharacterized protein n=1 Tax=Sporobolomyces salmoneus TaxID=183962 RepID=UPI00317AD1FD
MSSSSPDQDHFSLLPPELLGKIFSGIEGTDSSLVNPISKRFLPFQRETLYNRVTVRTYEQVDKLCWTAENNPNLLSEYVAQVQIYMKDSFDEITGQKTEMEDPLFPTSARIKQLFSVLTKVTKLSIGDSSRIASLVPTPQVAISSLPNLSNLRLSSNLDGFDDPFNPSFYTSLSNYTNLDKFYLYVYRDSASVRLAPKPPPAISPSLPSLLSLTLEGALSTSHVSVRRPISSFSTIQELRLEDTSEHSRMWEFVESLECPEDLSYLSLQRYTANLTPPHDSILDAVAGLADLSTLVLAGDVGTLYSAFPKALRKLPLIVLGFESDTEVDLKELTKLIKGPGKHGTLRTIWFDNVEGKVGTKIDDIGEPYFDMGTSSFGMFLDWEVPYWPDAFTKEEFKEFLKLAKQEGIEIKGRAIEAIEVDDQVEEELDDLAGFEAC